MKLMIGSDDVGFQLEVAMGDMLRSLGHEVLDVGAFNENPSDYPDYAEAVGRAVLGKKAERGVLAHELVKTFLGAKFSNEERHVRRLGKIRVLENKFMTAKAG
jgi:ribose 5-phosphate isomerase RpiB